jgi:hypothetical protein
MFPVTYDEGLCSYKAIAFIETVTISYLKSGVTPQKNVLVKQKPFRGFSKNLGEKLWTN